MNFRGRNKITPEFNMSSMTDVVFLLLIFFMIASTLAKQLDTIEVKLPQAKGKTENRQSVSVTINENNSFYIDGKRIAKAAIKKELPAILSAKEEKVIVLRAQKSIAIDQIVYVMNIANENAIKVVLAVDAQ